MQKNTIILFFVGMGLLSGCVTIRVPSIDDSSENALTNTSTEALLEDRSGAVQSPWPSLPAMMSREFNGRGLQLGSVLARTDAYTRYYVTYLSGDLTISGIMNVPVGSGPFPLLVLNHGYIDPAVYTNGRGLKREQDYLARRGYVVLHPDYRNHAASSKDPRTELDFRLGYTEDVINAVLAARELDFIDTSRVGMLGHSMGGGITQNVLVVRPELVKAAMLYAPVSADVRDNFDRWTRSRPAVANEIIAAHGEPSQNLLFWDDLSPKKFINNIQSPIQIHHGTADADVPLVWSQAFHEALVASGKESTLYIYDNEPHELIDQWPLMMQRTVDFFDQYFKQK